MVVLVDGVVRTVCDKAGISDILRSAGVKLGMDEVLREKGISGAEFENNPVVGAKRMGWNTLVFADAKSCHYIGQQEIEPVLKHVDECARIALTGKMEV